MIDWVTAKIPCIHVPIKAGQVMRLSPNGDIEWSTACRTQILGSFDSSISVRSQDSDGNGHATILHFSGNPAKFLQGHNVFGSDDLITLVYRSMQRICLSLSDSNLVTPFFEKSVDWSALASGDYEVDRFDVNYLYCLPSRSDVNQWLRAAEYTSHTRHGRPRNEKGTCYWGKNSRRWSIKAYSKAAEIERRDTHGLPPIQRFEKLREFVQNKLRLEVVLRQMELREQGIKYARDITPEKVQALFAQYLGRLQMSETLILSDQQQMKLPRKLQGTYLLWKQGITPFDVIPKATFYRHRNELLTQFGIDISNPPPFASGSNVVPLIKVLEAKPVEIPQWAYTSGLIAA